MEKRMEYWRDLHEPCDRLIAGGKAREKSLAEELLALQTTHGGCVQQDASLNEKNRRTEAALASAEVAVARSPSYVTPSRLEPRRRKSGCVF
jgi:hypothetical protein